MWWSVSQSGWREKKVYAGVAQHSLSKDWVTGSMLMCGLQPALLKDCLPLRASTLELANIASYSLLRTVALIYVDNLLGR